MAQARVVLGRRLDRNERTLLPHRDEPRFARLRRGERDPFLRLGAQVGTNGVNALAILGTNLLAETVWRVDGSRVTNGVSIADLLCTNGVLRTPARFAIEWKNTTELDPAALRFGSVYATVSAHRCDASYASPFCSICGHYEHEDLAFNSSQQIFTLKHDNQAYLSIIHPNSPGVVVTNARAQIRRQNESTWFDLGDLSSLSPWTARVAGFFELRGLADVDGRAVTTGVTTIEVRFPDCYDIACDPDFIGAADTEWGATLDDCTDVPNRRREHGFWILLNTETNRYEFGETKLGDWSTPTTNASVRPPPRPIDFPSNPTPVSPGLFYVVGWFHTHTPYTFMPTGSVRRVGPSGGDTTNNLSRQVASIIYDYIGAYDPENSTNKLEAGHSKSDPAQFYFVPPYRRPTPCIPVQP